MTGPSNARGNHVFERSPEPVAMRVLREDDPARQAALIALGRQLLAARLPWLEEMLRFVGGHFLVAERSFDIVISGGAGHSMLLVPILELAELMVIDEPSADARPQLPGAAGTLQ